MMNVKSGTGQEIRAACMTLDSRNPDTETAQRHGKGRKTHMYICIHGVAHGERLGDKYYPDAFSVVRRLLGSRTQMFQTARDVVHMVWLKLDRS
jgi:hypothetical protein